MLKIPILRGCWWHELILRPAATSFERRTINSAANANVPLSKGGAEGGGFLRWARIEPKHPATGKVSFPVFIIKWHSLENCVFGLSLIFIRPH